jgi:2-hydroxychromene-2-carboxylate isomerase
MAGSTMNPFRRASLDISSSMTATTVSIVHRRGDHNRLGFAVQLCTAHYRGAFAEDLAETPGAVVGALAQQLGIEPWSGFAEYGCCETKRPK